MGIVTRCIINRKANRVSTCTFDVLNPDATDLANYVVNEDVVILCFDGVIFSGVISNVDQITKSGYAVTTPFYTLQVECQGDFRKLNEVKVESTSLGLHDTDSSGDIIVDLLPSSWEGEIQITGDDFLYTVPNVDCATAINEIIDQTEYDWRCRRTYYRGEIYDIRTYYDAGEGGCQYVIEYIDSVNTGIDALEEKTVYIISGDQKYAAYGTVKYDFDFGAGGVNHRIIYITFGDAVNFGDDDTGTSCADCTLYLSDGDEFVIPLDPVFDYNVDLSTTDPVRTFYNNRDIFNTNDSESITANRTKVIVSGTDQNKQRVTSSLSAVYDEISTGVWDTTNPDTATTAMVLSTSGESVLYQDSTSYSTTTLNTQIVVRGHGLGFVNNEQVLVGQSLDAWTIAAASGSTETTSSSGDDVTILKFTSPIDDTNYKAGDPVLHGSGGKARIYCNDADGFQAGNYIYIGDEVCTVFSVDGSGLYLILNRGIDSTDIYAHPKGTLIRFWKNSTASTVIDEDNPASGSKVASNGIISKTVSVSGNCTRGDLDKYATNYLLGKSKFKDQGSAYCILKDFWKGDATHDAVGVVPITVGDTIRIYYNSTTYKDFQVLSYSANMTTRKVTMELGQYNEGWLEMVSNSNKSISRNIT